MRERWATEAIDFQRDMDAARSERLALESSSVDSHIRAHAWRTAMESTQHERLQSSQESGYNPQLFEQPTATRMPWEAPITAWPKLPLDWSAERMARFEQKYLHLLDVGYNDEDASWGATLLSQDS